MQYALLIYTPEWDHEPTPEEAREQSAAYDVFTKAIRADGSLRAGEALMPSATATTVRVRDGQTLTTDGPFAETKEVLGGFYVVEAPDLDAAIAYAARIPGAYSGSIEVRPLMEFNPDGSMLAPTAVGAD